MRPHTQHSIVLTMRRERRCIGARLVFSSFFTDKFFVRDVTKFNGTSAMRRI